ncbi:MAG: glycosyltransferase family 39 protein [Bacteroidia bacterium]|nr:glycosyltransferase family 39 protein [Bacteroidia bacterium]
MSQVMNPSGKNNARSGKLLSKGKQGIDRLTRRRDVLFAIAIAAGALFLRLLFLWSWSETPFFSRHFSDSKIYYDLAARILSGQDTDRAFFMSPLYPWLLSLIMRITEDVDLWMRLIQVLLGSVVVYLVWDMGRSLFGRGSAFIAAILTAASVHLIFYENMFLLDSLLTGLMVGSLYCLLRAISRGRSRDWVLSGALFGLAVLTRASAVLFLPMMLIAWMFRSGKEPGHFRGVGLWTGMSLLMLLPSTLHNFSAEGIILPVTSSFGYNLYAGNNPGAMGLYHMPEPVDLYSDPNGHQYAEARAGVEMNSAEVSSWWRDRAVQWVLAEPAAFMQLLGRKLLLMFHTGDIDQVGLSMAFVQKEYGTIPGLPLQVFPVVLVFGLAGMAGALRTGKNDWPLRLFFFTYLLSTALFFVSGRLRLPLLPMLYLYAGYGAMQFWRMFRMKAFGREGIRMVFGVLIAVVVLLVQPRIDQRFEQEYLKLGQISFDAGKYTEAAALFARSVDERPTVDGYVNHANALAAHGEFETAEAHFRQALKMDSTSALTWFNYGNMWMQRGAPGRAHACWMRAVETNPRFAPARRNLGLLLFRAGKLVEAEEQLARYVELETDVEQRASVQRDLANIRKLLRSPGAMGGRE